jgi:hypothetical protein
MCQKWDIKLSGQLSEVGPGDVFVIESSGGGGMESRPTGRDGHAMAALDRRPAVP